MIELIIGIVWESVVAFVTYLLYFTNTTVKVNGTYTSHDEFAKMLWPKILLGLVGIVGAFVLIKGIKKLIKNNKTEKIGEQCYGKICGIRPTGARFLNKPVYKVFVAVHIPSINKIDITETEIGTDNISYSIGSYVLMKYYKGNSKIEKIIENSNEIPKTICEQIEKCVEKYDQTHQTVNIKGVDITVEKKEF